MSHCEVPRGPTEPGAVGAGAVGVPTARGEQTMTTNQARLPGRRAGRPAPVRRPDAPPNGETSHSDGPVALPVPDNTIGLDVAVGLLFQAQDQVRRAGDSVGTLARALLPLGRRIARLPLVDTVGRHAATRLDHARERGTREVEAYRRRADAMVQQAASAALRSRAMDDIVGEVTTRFATPIVEAQLPVVLERLGERPEVLRPIVDQTVERFATRFMMPRLDVPSPDQQTAGNPPP